MGVANPSCQDCGACSAVCPLVEIDPSRKINMAFSHDGFNPWLCCSCHQCEAVCPAGLSPRDEMFVLRRARENDAGERYEGISVYMETLKRSGFVFPLSEETNEDREELGLPGIDYQHIAARMKAFMTHLEEEKKGSFAIGW